MGEEKGENKKVADRGSILLGLVFLAAGVKSLLQGYDAYQTGEMLAPTGKHGWMSGSEMMILGVMFLLFGAGFLLNEGVKAWKRKQGK